MRWLRVRRSKTTFEVSQAALPGRLSRLRRHLQLRKVRRGLARSERTANMALRRNIKSNSALPADSATTSLVRSPKLNSNTVLDHHTFGLQSALALRMAAARVARSSQPAKGAFAS